MVFVGGSAGMTDGELLERFLAAREEAAFEALLRRHGSMVLGVCRRVLRHEQDAEDAFQATFLVFARKATTIWPRDMVANWLFGVAYRTALGAKTAIARRRLKERQVNPMRPTDDSASHFWQDLQPLLDEELNHLPNKYRVPIVLCDLEGKSRQEAAWQLGWLPGTLSGRLARARGMLAKRLTRRGITVSGGVLAAALGQNLASASVPPSLLAGTVKASLMTVAGQGAAFVSAKVAALSEGVLKSMMITKAKIVTVAVLAIGFSVAGASLSVYHALAADQDTATAAGRAGRVNAPVTGIMIDPARPNEETTSPLADASFTDADREQIVGSGKALTKEFKIADFDSVDIRSIFEVEITQGDAFHVSVTADDNLFDYIKAAKQGPTLAFSLDSKDKSFHTKERLKAKVTMPSLRNLKIDGAAKATVGGFKASPEVNIEVSGASGLKGNLETKKIMLKAAGASHMKLTGSAKEAKLNVSGASHLDLSDFAVDQADVHLSGASHATVNAKSKLDYSVSGASHLGYRGEPTIGRRDKSGASHAGHVK
jgi:RNA polymerase sigma factor (sigma-70 family)